jgi:ABC-type multidrug transport system fused ATPase/permease subunit
MAEYSKLSVDDDPDDEFGDDGQPARSLFDDSPWWTRRVTHAWVAPILKVGSTKQLGMEDMPRCPAMVRVAPLLAAFDERVETKWDAHRDNLPLLRVLIGMMGCSSYIPMFLCVGSYHAISLINPMLLRELLSFVSDAERPVWHGLAIASAMFGLTCISGVCIAASVGINNTIGFKQQTILSAAVYRKALRLSRQQKTEQTVGELVNLMSNDCAKFEMVAHFADDLLFPFYLGGCIGLLYLILGVAVVPGIFVMGASVITNFQTGKWLMKVRRRQLANTDKRVQLVSEALSGIRVVKYNVMESWLSASINEVRAEELRLLRTQAYLNALNRFMNFATPLIVALVTFGTYIALGAEYFSAPVQRSFCMSVLSLSWKTVVFNRKIERNWAVFPAGNVLTAGDVFSSLAFFALVSNDRHYYAFPINR